MFRCLGFSCLGPKVHKGTSAQKKKKKKRKKKLNEKSVPKSTVFPGERGVQI